MPIHYRGRVFMIVAILLVALWKVFPGALVGNFKPDLKPGIDMVGGTSLLYEIKPAEGTVIQTDRDLAERVMESLKKRVDPDGVRNLIWRPQGGRRLEIQMPLSASSQGSEAKRTAFVEAQRALDATNVRPSDVIDAVEQKKGADRDAALKSLAMDSTARQKLFAQLSQTWDTIQDARAKKDAARQADAENQYDDLKGQIADTNLPTGKLQSLLDLKSERKEPALKALRDSAKDFPARLAAVERFEKAYTEFQTVRNSIDSAAELKRLLRGSGVLEFYILAQPFPRGQREATITAEKYQEMVARLQKDGPVVRAGDTTRWFELAEKSDLKGEMTQTYNDKTYVLAHTDPRRSLTNRPGQLAWALDGAYPIMESGERKVGFRFNSSGGKLFGDLTGGNIGLPLAIVLDGKIISAPNINQQINGSGEISGGGDGGFGEDDARYLISTLDAGSLPAQLTDEPISERTVGPQLGQDNLKAGLMACIFGLVVVAVFLIGYYYLAGVVAMIAVLINVALILGVMSMLGATFTLPGVAGIVLSIGAAVDANVLIFERLREEQHRGLSLNMALRNAYERAWGAIVDSNATTVVTSLFLYWLGSEEVKGFGITLLIGLCSSMFTALFVTKTIFGILIKYFGVRDLRSLPLTFPKWDKMLQPNIDWLKMVPYFLITSAVLIAIGCGAFFYYGKQGQLMDIEFASGTSVQFELKQPMSIEEVRKLVPQDDPNLPAPAVQTVGAGDKSYEVTTPSADSVKVRDVILRVFGDRLQLELPSTFDNVGTVATDVVGKSIIPLEADHLEDLKKATGGFVPENWRQFRGGAAIVLNNLEPALKPEEIRVRIERERLQPTAGDQAANYHDFKVETPGPVDQPTKLAVVLITDPALPYADDPGKWLQDLATPSWKLMNESINKPPSLQKITNFDAQVAGDAQRNALGALALSLLVIMAYIWLRFGNLKFGTATVIAMLHDTVLVIAAIGVAHLLANTFIGRALLLEPFRINLTLVAAILTVMSYSMIDTIVVFDRVRENRGKFGHLDHKVVNDSINQTLARTLLTAGTNITTVLFMYCFGGSGIHGFTFALLIGILVGTYSSIAIAAPILLVGGESKTADDAAARQRRGGQLQQA